MGNAPSPMVLAQIHAAAFTQSRPWSQDEFTALLDSPLCFACGDGRSFALVRVIADEAELLTIATDPACQRQGLARALMQDWQTQARLRAHRPVFWRLQQTIPPLLACICLKDSPAAAADAATMPVKTPHPSMQSSCEKSYLRQPAPNSCQWGKKRLTPSPAKGLNCHTY